MALSLHRLSRVFRNRGTMAFSTQTKTERWPEKIPKEFIDEISDRYNLEIPNKDAPEYAALVGNLGNHWKTVDNLYEQYENEINPPIPNRTYTIPEFKANDNKFGQWTAITDIKPTNTKGPLQGKTFGIKDNIFVAGIPTVNGSKIFEDFSPKQDATVVERILNAGGTIKGKTQCENLCYSGGSHTSHPNPVLNPNNILHHAGGSSSGSSCAVITNSCDMAIGGDQGGSIRLPSAWCGTVGFKATWGTVPYTGAVSLDPHFDHLGPITKTVSDSVDLLKVIAGKDGYDLRQLNAPQHNDNKFISALDSALLQNDCSNIKIGLVKQGFNDCEYETAENVKIACDSLSPAKLIEVDVAIHDDALSIWCAIGISGQHITMYLNGGIPALPRGKYDDNLSLYARDGRENGLMKYSQINIMNIIAGEWMFKNYSSYYAIRGTELSRIMAKQYENIMDKNDLDVLIYPTIKYTAPLLPTIDTPDMTPTDCVIHGLSNIANTVSSSVTGHPTISIPVKPNSFGMPIGMSIVAKNHNEAKCVHVAQVYEKIRGELEICS